jgi:outer membrane autotransporter protein
LATGSVQVDGTFTQSVWGDSPFFGLAADHRVDGQLTVGSRGTYSLTGGSLTSEGVHVDGTFDQQGGDHSVDGLLTVRSQATYRLTGGSLTSEGVRVDGTFDQQGGDHSVEGLLTVGSQGTYSLSRGILTAGGIRNDGTLIFNPGEDSELSASISGTGELRKQGAATLELTGTNSFSGRTSVETGVLKGDTASLQGPTIVIGQGATLELDQQSDGVYGGSISGDGALRKDGDAALFLRGNNSYAGGTAILSGVLQGDTGSLQGNITNSGTVVFDQAATGIYAGTISGSGNLVKQGNGLLIFNGSSTHVGGTQIVDGNVQIGDASHPGASISGLVSIGLNGILSGQGTIYGDVDNVGTIAPGGSIGALRVAGDVAFHPGSRFQVAVSPDAASRLIVDGVASLGGAQVEAVATHGSYGPNRYEVLSAASIEGRFADALISSFEAIDPLLIPALGYGGGNVYLDLEPAPLSNPMGPGKEVVTDLIQMIDRLTTGRFPQALGALSPNDLGLWARGFGMVSSASAEGDEPGYEGDARGFLIGFDGQITDRLSLGIAGFSADVDVKTEVSYTDRSSVNVGGFNLYAAYTLDAWQVRSALGYTSERYSSRQSIGSGTQFRRARGSMDARRISGCTEGSWTFKSGSLSLQPTLGLQYGWLEQDDFTQRGLYADGQSLNVNSRSQYLFDTVVGGRVRYDAVISRNTEVQAEARAMYVHRFGELDDRMDGTSSNGTRVSLGTQDRPGDRDAAIVGAGITVLTADNLHLYAEYSGQFLSGRSSNAFSAGVRYVW